MKRKSLEQMKGGYSTFSYKPVRSCFDDILNIQPSFGFGSAPATPWSVVEAELKKRCKSDEEFVYNRRVALGLHDFASSDRVIGRRQEFLPLVMGMGHKVTFWLPMVLAIDEQPSATFIEPRSTKGLTSEGRKVAFSMMRERTERGRATGTASHRGEDLFFGFFLFALFDNFRVQDGVVFVNTRILFRIINRTHNKRQHFKARRCGHRRIGRRGPA